MPQAPETAAPPTPASSGSLRRLADVPGPPGRWLVGNLLDVDISQLHRILYRWADRYGPLYRIRLMQHPILVVADHALIHDILRQRPDTFMRGRSLRSAMLEVGVDGVFNAEGRDWRRQRALAMHALNTHHLRSFFPRLEAVTGRLQRRWQRAADEGAVLDIQRELMRFTVDVTTGLAFGHDLNTIEQEGDLIQTHMEKLFPALLRRTMAPFPYWRWIRLPADHALDRAMREVRRLVTSMIEDCRRRVAAEPERRAHPTNFIEAMLAAQDDEARGFSDAEIFGNAITMLVAGEDTTANAISWMLHLMIERPEVQTRLQAEVDAVVGSADLPRDHATASGLGYIEAMAHEALRMKPVAPFLALEARVDVQLGGVQVPAGTGILALNGYPGATAAHFEAPDAFRPERWLDAERPAADAHDTRAFLPFGAGPRFCPGRHLAMLEIQMVMAMIARHFDVRRAPGTAPAEELFAFTMMPKDLFVQLVPRSPAAVRAAGG
jgi:cytochrome P450